jgi:hypothetical protein
MSKHSIKKSYVSHYDKFLQLFDRKHQKSVSQLKEIQKYQRIAALRDHSDPISLEVDKH